MKKALSLIFTCFVMIGTVGANMAFANYNITPKAPTLTPALKPIADKYKAGNYLGAMLDAEELVKKDKNNTYAKYYLALCYTRLGYKDEAKTLYKEISAKNDSLVLTYYSKKALNCLDNPNSDLCIATTTQKAKEPEPTDDITEFIRSGKQIHPSAMDRITRERAERKMQEELYLYKKQLDAMEGNVDMELSQPQSAPKNDEESSDLSPDSQETTDADSEDDA